jgi:hypothetical protein
MTERRQPLHLAVFLGLSAGAYAVSLAGVTALQARSEAAILADRGPTTQAIDRISAAHDRLEGRADRVAAAFARAAGGYDAVGQGLVEVEANLSALADVVGSIDGAARALPARAALPTVSRSVTAVARPAVHATTAASGG